MKHLTTAECWKKEKPGQKERERCVRRTDVDLLSCNRGPISPDLEHTSLHAHAHASRVTRHKEPLCRVTEHRKKDKGLEGCDMTNMRGFVGLRGDWHYSQGWLTLLICITHQSRSQQRRADRAHTWSMDTKPTVFVELEKIYLLHQVYFSKSTFYIHGQHSLLPWFSFDAWQRTQEHNENIPLQLEISKKRKKCPPPPLPLLTKLLFLPPQSTGSKISS